MICFGHLRGAIEIGPGRMVTRVAFFLWATAYPAWDILPITTFLQKLFSLLHLIAKGRQNYDHIHFDLKF